MKEYMISFPLEHLSLLVPEGTTILEAERMAGLQPDAPCGGKGSCGKCLVRLFHSKTPEEGEIVKACSVPIHFDCTVETSLKATGHTILTKGVSREISVSPLLRFVTVRVEKCQLGENLSDWERLTQAISRQTGIPAEEIPVNLFAASVLGTLLKLADQEVAVLLFGKEVLDISIYDFPCYLAAFDIGTTTIVGYLLDADTGEELAVESLLNPQSEFGADVIMRANYCLEHSEKELSAAVRKAMNHILERLCEKADIAQEEIWEIAVVGNTCMHHLLLGISPYSLVHAPYNPVIRQPLILNAADYDIAIHPLGKMLVLPNIAGFVGADTCGCLLATDFDSRTPVTLMIDIGTNGELVLGNKDHMVTCSTAAGPAFEGAKITCGMRGAAGAIDHVDFQEGKFTYSTIQNKKPAGICGSGLMDLIAKLLENGFIDSSGRILDPEEVTHPTALANKDRLVCIDEKPAFLLASLEETQNRLPIYLTQSDVREVQLAKSAIAAGITLLAKQLGLQVSDIQEVLIAGAFGNYMDPKSACAIGLLPSVLDGRITAIGNAAGEGCKIALLNQEEFLHCEKMASSVEFLELASSAEFQDCFVDELEFPEQPWEGDAGYAGL